MTGTIFDIQRFAIHDGPGIRTTVFLKGCALGCVWCHNPEGISPGKGLWVKKEKCIKCGSCIAECPEKSLSLTGDGILIDRVSCSFCDRCTKVCPAKAISRIDREIRIDDLMEELVADRIFYTLSDGGVTLSGGEPLSQADFAIALFTRLKAAGIHTCIETCMMAQRPVIERLPAVVDHFLVDIKLMDQSLHQKYTGVSNAQILENFRYLAKTVRNLTVRVPLIPGITATEDNLREIGRFVRSCNPDLGIELLNFNWISRAKYNLMNQPHFNDEARAFSTDQMARFTGWVADN
jgi:pyruvate formate lyase activating enzyme